MFLSKSGSIILDIFHSEHMRFQSLLLTWILHEVTGFQPLVFTYCHILLKARSKPQADNLKNKIHGLWAFFASLHCKKRYRFSRPQLGDFGW